MEVLKERGKALRERSSSLRVSPLRQLHQPATTVTTSHPRRHRLPTTSVWLAWDRSIYVTVTSLNAFSTSARSAATRMLARVGIRVPLTLPFLLPLLIIHQTITVLCASFIFISLFSRFSRIWHPLHIQSLQQHKQSSTLTTTLPTSLQQP